MVQWVRKKNQVRDAKIRQNRRLGLERRKQLDAINRDRKRRARTVKRKMAVFFPVERAIRNKTANEQQKALRLLALNRIFIAAINGTQIQRRIDRPEKKALLDGHQVRVLYDRLTGAGLEGEAIRNRIAKTQQQLMKEFPALQQFGQFLQSGSA